MSTNAQVEGSGTLPGRIREFKLPLKSYPGTLGRKAKVTGSNPVAISAKTEPAGKAGMALNSTLASFPGAKEAAVAETGT